MNSYAQIVNGIVVNAIVADAEFIATLANKDDYKPLTRGGIGWTYDSVNNVFIAPQPYASWTLDEFYDWQPPTPKPAIGMWYWNEDQLKWVLIQ